MRQSADSPPPDRLEGSLDRVVFSNPENAWSVVRIKVAGRRAPVTAVGNLLSVQPGEHLQLHGEWIDDPKFGRQFKVSSYATLQPASLEGIEKYLGSGLIKGVGPGMAARLVAKFGLETLEVIEDHPERLAQVDGIGPKRRAEIRRAWVEQRAIKELMIFLASHGISTGLAVKIFKHYGEEALGVVQRDPFRLARDLFGVGFKTADRIASSIGLPADSPERARAGVVHLLDAAADQGHTYLPRQDLERQAAELLGVDPALPARAIEALAAAGEVVVDERKGGGTPDPSAVFLSRLYAAETGVADRIHALTGRPADAIEIDLDRAVAWFEKREDLSLAPRQRAAIRAGLSAEALIVTGGPGTGKTTLVRGIVEILARKKVKIALAAPTGRAAKRLGEATGREARTVHRLLEFNPKRWGFERGPQRPLDADVVIVDEASMLDVHLAHQLLLAIPDRSRLILVGDVDQLPSVGPGRVLADLIDCGAVEVIRLTEIFRQARRSLIVTNAHRVNRGEMPELGAGGKGDDFFIIERGESDEILETLLHLVSRRIPGGFDLDPIRDIQVLTPMNRGPLGTERLNRKLRELLNPTGKEVTRGGRSLRVGDKVMQRRNNYELEVFNGDLGRIEAIDEEEEEVRIRFDDRLVNFPFSTLDEVTAAYACSIHKSQGSEYPCVVIPLHSQHYVMLQRNLLYTALTRARRLAIVVGERRALATAIRNQSTRQRFTLLARRLGIDQGPGGSTG